MIKTVCLQLFISFVFLVITPFELLAQQSQIGNQSVSYLDQGYYKVYRFTEDEIDHLTDAQLTDILMIYADRFYPFHMSISRNYFSPALEHKYPITMIEPVFKKIVAMSDSEKKKRVHSLYIEADGVAKVNQDLYLEMRRLIGNEEIKIAGRLLADQKGVQVNRPSEILQAYQFKMGLLTQRPDPSLFDFIINFLVKFKIYLLSGVAAFFLGIFASVSKGNRNRVL